MPINNISSLKDLKQPSFKTSIPTFKITIDKRWKLKDVASVLCFPIGLYKLFHILAGYAIIPSALSLKFKKIIYPLFNKNDAEPVEIFDPNKNREQIKTDTLWTYQRITIEVDGNKIDAMIAFNNKKNTDRWVLASNGNNDYYERGFTNRNFQRLASQLEGNIISFNYPGVGASTGLPTKPALAKAYRAILQVLETHGAKEIVGYGFSVGGAVQAEAIKKHEFKTDIKYVFIKDRTFSSLAQLVSKIGLLIKGLKWNLNSVESSQKLTKPEIILQTGKQEKILTHSDQLKEEGDEVISKEASLANALLNPPKQEFPSAKKIIGTEQNHFEDLSDNDLKNLAKNVNSLLKNQ